MNNFIKGLLKANKGEIIFEGKLEGKIIEVSTVTGMNIGSNFVFKPNENISGIPERFICSLFIPVASSSGIGGMSVSAPPPFMITNDDDVIIEGKLARLEIKQWEKDTYVMFVTGLYNKTLQCGY